MINSCCSLKNKNIKKYSKKIRYICSCHSNIIKYKPGICLKCGMSLEKIDISFNQKNIELINFINRLYIAVPFTLILLFIEMSNHFLNINLLLNLNKFELQLFSLIVSIPTIYIGLPFFKRGIYSFKSKKLNMYTLISVGVFTTFIYSIIAMFLPNLFPISMQTIENTVPVYFESASIIITLVLLGQILEIKSKEKINYGIKKLLNLVPETANYINKNGIISKIKISKITKNIILRVYPGERIPVDGVIIHGKSYVDESMITGEFLQLNKIIGSNVIGGTINITGIFDFKALKIGNNTILVKIIKMVSNAQRSYISIQSITDKIMNYFIPIIFIIAIITFILWMYFGVIFKLNYAIIAAVNVLIIACPCAIGLATPMSIMVAIGQGIKNGLLIKNAEQLEKMKKVNVVIIDKTGTITTGKPTVKEIVCLNDNYTILDVVKYIASVEQFSTHPIAYTILNYVNKHNIKLIKIEKYKEILGFGIKTIINGKTIFVGNLKFMQKYKINFNNLSKNIIKKINSGYSPIYLSIDYKAIGLIFIVDKIKKNSKLIINNLHYLGIKTVIATGDTKQSANFIKNKIKVDEVYSSMSPYDKIKLVKKFQKNGKIVAMVGDGINDTPALSQADVGIAIGTGSDVAIENAGITIINGSLSGIFKIKRLSIATIFNIKQNLFLASIYNIVCIPIAAGILFPFTGILLSPIVAATAMSLSSLSVILNALRLYNVDLNKY